jgi:hypothetical protein
MLSPKIAGCRQNSLTLNPGWAAAIKIGIKIYANFIYIFPIAPKGLF